MERNLYARTQAMLNKMRAEHEAQTGKLPENVKQLVQRFGTSEKAWAEGDEAAWAELKKWNF